MLFLIVGVKHVKPSCDHSLILLRSRGVPLFAGSYHWQEGGWVHALSLQVIGGRVEQTTLPRVILFYALRESVIWLELGIVEAELGHLKIVTLNSVSTGLVRGEQVCDSDRFQSSWAY